MAMANITVPIQVNLPDDWIEQIVNRLRNDPESEWVEVVRCKDCIHQQKVFHEDKRRKDGGYYIFGCEFAEGYSHVCLDDEYCSEGKRRTDETD